MFLVARNFLIAMSLGLLGSAGALAQSAQSWEQILAAAKKEGMVSVIGPQGSETRDALTLAFQKKYPDIRVDLQSMAGSQIGPKLFNELAAGRNSTDVLITGTTTALETLLPAKALVAVKPWLSGPNTQDPSKWRGGKLTFSDDAQSYNLVFSAYVKAPFIYNSQLVSGADFKSWKDLLEPKWQGKIALKDPVGAGGGLGNSTLWYSHAGLGKDFMRKIFALKDLVMPRDDRQMLDFAARGKYPIAIGPSDVLTNEFIARGLPLKHLRSGDAQRGNLYYRGQWQPGDSAQRAPSERVASVCGFFLIAGRPARVEQGRRLRQPAPGCIERPCPGYSRAQGRYAVPGYLHREVCPFARRDRRVHQDDHAEMKRNGELECWSIGVLG